MQEVMIGLQFSVLIPILVYMVCKPTLNIFFKLLFASILLSGLSDIIGTTFGFIFKNNIPVFTVYFILNSILLIYMWKKVPFYPDHIKRFVGFFGYFILALIVLVTIYYKMTIDSFYINSCLNVLLSLVFALQYYYQKINLSSYTPILHDPYFIAASGFILFSLSTIIILAVQIQFAGRPFISYTWVLRQAFYMVFNIIIGYSFYVLYKTQQIR